MNKKELVIRKQNSESLKPILKELHQLQLMYCDVVSFWIMCDRKYNYLSIINVSIKKKKEHFHFDFYNWHNEPELETILVKLKDYLRSLNKVKEE